MANEEHLEQLKQGVTAWNDWRSSNPNITPDLAEADLIDASLARADLTRAVIIDALTELDTGEVRSVG